MYSPVVIEARTSKLVERLRRQKEDPKFDLIRHPVGYVDEVTSHLNSLIDRSKKKPTLTRALTDEELAFIENERHLCRLDFRYYQERYAYCYRDDKHGNIGRMDLWYPQEVLLHRIEKLEKEMWDLYARGAIRFDGLCFIIHKARQLGFTMLVQLLFFHRINFYSGVRGLTASSTPDKTKLIYQDRTKILMNRMPWWLQSEVVTDRADEGFLLANESRMVLQAANQVSGIGQGNQYDVSHLTECASWPNPSDQIENHFFKTIPQSLRAMSFLESTAQELSANGAQWWRKVSEQARAKRKARWQYLFVPWYAEPLKNMITPPLDWEPTEATLVHAKIVENTSPEWMEGRTVVLSREQLYWYERERAAADEGKELHNFLMNYCATPEESFKFAGAATFTQRVIDVLSSNCEMPVPYELVTPATPSSRLWTPPDTAHPVQSFTWGRRTLSPVILSESDPIDDPRGLLIVWEAPDPRADYFIGVDAARGIHEWTRFTSFKGDDEYDNGVVSVWKRMGDVCVQVAEFAAPIPEPQLAVYANLIGRMYCGRNDDGQAPMIIEVAPLGLTTQQTLFQVYDYFNFYKWHRVIDGVSVSPTPLWGWHSNNQSLRVLTAQGTNYVNSGRAIYRSRWAVNELEFCKTDPVKMRLAALQGYHDDRVIGSFLAFWFANDWVLTGADLYEPDMPEVSANQQQPVRQPPNVQRRSWQNTDVDYDEMMDEWNDRIDDIVYGRD